MSSHHSPAPSLGALSPRSSPAPAIGVLGLGTYLPRGTRSNQDVAAAAGVTPEWIARRTGVHTRHVADPGQAASDLAAAAVRAAVAAAGLDLDQLDVLICATSTPDELG